MDIKGFCSQDDVVYVNGKGNLVCSSSSHIWCPEGYAWNPDLPPSGKCQRQTAPGINNILIQDTNGNNVARLDDNGNIRLKGKCIFAVSCNNPTNDAFKFQDAFGNTKAYIDFVNGDLCVSDNPCPHHSSLCSPPPDGSFIIKDSSNAPQIYIDLNGHLCLKGSLYESTTP